MPSLQAKVRAFSRCRPERVNRSTKPPGDAPGTSPNVATDAAAPPSDAEAPEPERTMPEMSEAAIHELAQYRVIAPTPAEAQRKVAELEKDNQKERDKVRDLTEKLKAVPAEGSVVIPPGEEATEYAAWKALGVKAADVSKLQETNATLTAEKARRDRQDILTAASPTEGWNENAPKALLKLAGFDAVELTAGEVTVERVNAGKKENVKAPTAFVTVDGKPVRISEWLSKEAPEFVTLLTAQVNGNGNGASGIPVPEQRGASGESKVSTEGGIDDLIARNQAAAKAPNALRPAKATA